MAAIVCSSALLLAVALALHRADLPSDIPWKSTFIVSQTAMKLVTESLGRVQRPIAGLPGTGSRS
jgi:hypothetical protein